MVHRARLHAVAVLAVLALAAAPAHADLFFSEYIEGSSNNKALEITNLTGQTVNLSGYRVRMYFNGNTSAGLTIFLNAHDLPDGGIYVLAHSQAVADILTVADQTNGAGWFNGDDAVTLERPDGTVVDSIGQIGFDPGSQWGTGNASTADNTLRRKQGITTGDTNPFDAFDPSVEWDGFPQNTFDGLGPPPPPPVLVTINEIQGDGLFSPLANVRVETHGDVVTAVGVEGFFMQTPDDAADLDPATSNGIFVFTGSPPAVAIGDEVTVVGFAQEFFELTEIGADEVTVTASGLALPGVVTIDEAVASPAGTLTQLEPLEGMLVRLEDGEVVGPSDRFGEFAVIAGGPRPFREPGILVTDALPGLPVWDGNPELFEINPDGAGLPDEAAAAGATVTAEGALTFAFGDYQIFPTALTITGEAEVRSVRAREPGELSIAAQNVLRLFDTVNDPGVDDEVVDADELALRLEKLSAQVRDALGGPDILAVQEVENLGVLQLLAARIAADDPSLVYTAHLLEGNDIGGIDVGYLVRDTVEVHALEQFGKDDELAPGDPLNDRPPLVLRGAYVGNGAPYPLVVINVHQRSLNGIDGLSSGADRVRAKRFQQAVRLAELIQAEQTAAPGARIVVVGDYNAFEFTDGYVDVMGIVTGRLDPLGALLPGVDIVDPDLTNWTFALAPDERYSFVFDGSAQSLDHVVTTGATDRWVRGVEHARGNADAPESLSDVPGTALRSADHDGSVVYLMTDEDADDVADDVDECPGTSIPEAAGSSRLLPNHFALVDGDFVFDRGPVPGEGEGETLSFTTQDTRGCSCEQIATALGLGAGHFRFGCSPEVMSGWAAGQ